MRECRNQGISVNSKRVGKVAGEMGFVNNRLRIDGERERVWCSPEVAQMKEKEKEFSDYDC